MSYLLATFLSCISLGLLFDYSMEINFSDVFVYIDLHRCDYFVLLSHSHQSQVQSSTSTSCGGEQGEETHSHPVFIMTAVSLLMWLPFIVHTFFWLTHQTFCSWTSHLSLVVMLVEVNSLVNPLCH